MNKIAVKLSVFAIILLVCLQAGFLIFIVREGAPTKYQLLNLRLPFAGDNLPRHYSYQAAENKIPLNESPAVNLLFFGDMMLDRHVGEKISQNGLDYIFAKLAGEENRFFKGVEIGEKKIGMAGFSMVYNQFDLTSAQKIISQLTSQTDLIIINIHFFSSSVAFKSSRIDDWQGKAGIFAAVDR